MQILTPDFSGRRPPPPPPPPPPPSPLPTSPLPTSPLLLVFLPSSLPPSLLPLRKFDSVLSSLFGMRLALRILRPHSLTLTLTLSLSHCLSHLSHLFLISLISLSSLSLSPLCLSSFRLSSLSSLAGGSGQRATYKGLFTPASKKSAVFFPTSLPSTFPFWSASFRPPLGLKLEFWCRMWNVGLLFTTCIIHARVVKGSPTLKTWFCCDIQPLSQPWESQGSGFTMCLCVRLIWLWGKTPKPRLTAVDPSFTQRAWY